MKLPRPIISFAEWLAPELRFARTPFERSEAIHRSGIFGLLAIPLAAAFALAFVLLEIIFAPGGPPQTPVVWVSIVYKFLRSAVWLIPIGMTIAALYGVQRRRPEVRAFLHARGVPLCLHCGYDLSATSPEEHLRCPECGQPLIPEKT